MRSLVCIHKILAVVLKLPHDKIGAFDRGWQLWLLGVFPLGGRRLNMEGWLMELLPSGCWQLKIVSCTLCLSWCRPNTGVAKMCQFLCQLTWWHPEYKDGSLQLQVLFPWRIGFSGQRWGVHPTPSAHSYACLPRIMGIALSLHDSRTITFGLTNPGI